MVAIRRGVTGGDRAFCLGRPTLHLEVLVGTLDGSYPTAAGQAAGLDAGHTGQPGDLNRCLGVP